MEELATRTNVDKAHGAIPIGCLDLSDPSARWHFADADDPMMTQETELFGEDQNLFLSDFPHDEARGDAMKEILERHDLSAAQKRKILCDNTVRFFDGK
jgi:predicted TIM-barrel fold metal-dependent hydrolase